MVSAKEEDVSYGLEEMLQPVPAHVLYPPRPETHGQGRMERCCSEWCRPSPPSYEANMDGILSYRVRPSNCNTCLMGPCCMFLGCCFDVSAYVKFNNNNQTIKIFNWPGYLCCWPCLKSTEMAYSQVGNIGIIDTGGREGSEHNQQPIYDVVLVERNAKSRWVIGFRGDRSYADRQAADLHRFLFAQGNPNYRRTCEVFLPTNDCC